MLPQERHNIEQVKSEPICGAVRVFEWDHSQTAVVEGQFDQALAFFLPFEFFGFATPLGAHLLCGNPHFVLGMTSFSHF